MKRALAALAALTLLCHAPAQADSFGSGLEHDPPCASAWANQDWGDVEIDCAKMADEAHAKAVADPKNAMEDLTVEGEADYLVGRAYLNTGDRSLAWDYAHKAYTIEEIVVETLEPQYRIFPDLYESALKVWRAAGELQAQAGGPSL